VFYEDSQPEAPATRSAETEQAPRAPAPKVMPTLARRSAGGKKGGRAAKPSPILTGLGASSPAAIRAEDLATLDGRLELLRAVAEAVVMGRCSSATATTLVSLVKAAAEDVRQDQGAQLEALARRLDEVLAGRVH
jgi:hypothetical protein